MMEKELRVKISIDKNTKAVNVVGAEFDELGKQVKKTDQQIDSFSNTLKSTSITSDRTTASLLSMTKTVGGLYFSYQTLTHGANSYIKTSDDFKLVSGRLRLVTESMRDLKSMQSTLLDVSNDARVGYADTIDLYSRIARSTKEMNNTSEERIAVTDTISKSLILSGAAAESSNAAMVQLGQGFASGTLRGQELMSVMEQTPRLAEAIASGLGISIGELRKYGEEGKLTASAVFNAILSQQSKIESEFAKMPITVGQGFTVLSNDMMSLVGSYDELTGTTKSVSNSILELSSFLHDNRDAIIETGQTFVEVSKHVGFMGTTLVAGKVAIYAYRKASLALTPVVVASGKASLSASLGIKAVTTNATLASRAVKTLKASMMSFAPTALVLAAGEALYTWSDALDKIDEKYEKMEERTNRVLQANKKTSTSEIERLKKAISGVEKNLENVGGHHEGLIKLRESLLSQLEVEEMKASRLAYVYEASLNASQKTWEEYYKNINNYEKAWLVSESRSKAYDEALGLGLDGQALESYVVNAKQTFYKPLSDERTKEQQELYKSIEANKKYANTLQKQLDILSSGDGNSGSAKSLMIEYYETIGDYATASAIKAEQAFSKFLPMGKDVADQMANLTETSSFKEYKDKNISFAIDGIDESMGKMTSVLDTQISLAESGMNWGNSLDGVAKSVANVSKAFLKMDVSSMKFEKADLKLQQDYAKEFLKAQGNITKQNELSKKFDIDHAALKTKQRDAELDGYSELAGAVSNVFTEGSDAAKAFEVVQAGLLVTKNALILAEQYHQATMAAGEAVKATSIATDGAKTISGAAATIATTGSTAPFPLTIPAITAAMGILAPILAMVGGSSGGSSGGGAQAAMIQESQFTAEITEMTMQPMLDRLDRIVELVEIIGLKGTAERTRVQQSQVQYNMDTALLAEEIIQGTQTITVKAGNGGATVEGVLKRIENQFIPVNELLGRELFQISEDMKTVTFSAKAFRADPLAAIAALYEKDALKALSNWKEAQDAGARTWEQFHAFSIAQGKQTVNDLQAVTHEYIMSLSDVVDGLSDAKNTFKEIYDELTETTTFKSIDLNNAFSEVKQAIGDKSLPDYLANQVFAISEIEKMFSSDITELFLSQDPNDLQKQADALAELNKAMDNTFFEGTEDALNYLESIEKVGEAMVNSSENQKSFIDSFKTDEQIAKDMAKKFNVSLASTGDELVKLFNELSLSGNLLTDSELELLEANKALMESGLDEYIENVTGNINTLEGALDSMSGIIEKLKKSAYGSSYTLQNYYDSMNKTLQLLKTDEYETFQESLQKTISYSDALFESSNFETKNDMEFAQLVAASQFESMEASTLQEIDYLKQIEENTRGSMEALQAQIGKIETTVTGMSNNPTMSYTDALVQQAYQDVLGRDAETAGAAYWSQQLSTGSISVSELNIAIANGAQGADIASAQDWLHGSHRDGLSFVPFDGYIAELHEGERVLTADENLGGFSAVVAEIRALREALEQQTEINIAQANEIKTLRKELEDQGYTLQDIEEKIA